MGVKEKKHGDYVAQTMCDFNQLHRAEPICNHYSLAAAFRAHRTLWDIYTKIHGDRIWIELVRK